MEGFPVSMHDLELPSDKFIRAKHPSITINDLQLLKKKRGYIF
jgi:hypothetical protein